MTPQEKLKYMNEAAKQIVDYLQDQANINIDALRAYNYNPVENDGIDPEVKKMREIQAMILREKTNELNRHIAVIKRMFPSV